MEVDAPAPDTAPAKMDVDKRKQSSSYALPWVRLLLQIGKGGLGLR